MKPTDVQNLREAYMNEVWGDALNSRQKEKGLPKPGGPQPKAKRSAAGDEGTTGDALGARLTATPPKRSKKDDKPKTDAPKADAPKKDDKSKTDTRTRWQKRLDARRSSSPAARANTNDKGQSIKTDKPVAKKDKETVAPRTAPKSAPSGASDPRNAEYIKKRSAIAKAKSPEDKAKATKDAESAGMAAWRKANPKLAARLDKKNQAKKDKAYARAGFTTGKKDNKIDKDSVEKSVSAAKDREAAAVKAGRNPSKPNPDLKGKKDSDGDPRQAKTGSNTSKTRIGAATSLTNKTYTPPKKDAAPKADAPKAAAPKADAPKAAAPKAAAPAPSKAVTPPPSAKPSQPGAPIVATAKQFSKGGKYRRESLMSFGAYQLSEKKTSVKINPKLKDLEEDCLNEGSCAGHSEGGEIVNGKCTICGMAPKKSLKKEETAYVSQEEVSEESYQEGYETETDLTEGEQLDEIMSDKMIKAVYPKGMSKGLGQTIKPGGSNALGIKNDATSAGGGKYFTNNARLLARAPAQYIRGVVPDAKKDAAPKPAGPKPTQDMNLNRQGGPSSPPPSGGANKPMSSNRPKPAAPKANTSGLSGKKPSDLLSKGGKVKKSVNEMTQQEIHEEYVQIQEFLGKIFKGVKNFVGGLFGGGQKQQAQAQPKQQSMKDYKPAEGLKLKGNMNDNRPKISNSTGSNQPFSGAGKPSGDKPSNIADIKSGTPEKVDKGLPNRKDKKKDKRFDEEVECTSDYIGPDERTKMKNEIILAKRAMRAANAAKQKAMSDNERILKSLGKFGKTTPEECDK